MISPATDFDVIIIGGGPAGSCAGAALAREGLRVLITEKAEYPEYRIGESLLPNGNKIFKEIGVWEKIKAAGFIPKYGAEFETADGSKNVHNIFARGLGQTETYTYQVERPKFDALLLDHAAESGCVVDRSANITEIKRSKNKHALTSEDGRNWTSKWLIDATGRRRLLSKTWNLPYDSNPFPSRIAVYSHFTNVTRKSGKERGNIIITRLPKGGWFWTIPISENTTSVGFVSLSADLKASGLSPREWFKANLQKSEAVSKRMEGATELIDYRTTTDYSFMHEKFCGSNYFLIGDAATFSDPMFSSGVYLGLESARSAARAIIKADAKNRFLTEREQTEHTVDLKKRTQGIRHLIDTFYSDSGFAVFMNPTDKFKLFAAVNAVVAGNTKPGFSVRWRYKLFRVVCHLNKQYRLVPPALPVETQGHS